MKRIFLLIFLILINFSLKSQFKRITVNEGLSVGVIHSILKDKRGFIWFGTNGGLNRYDGYNIKEYKKNSSPFSISDNQILAITEDNDGTLWIGTANGLNNYNPVTDKFSKFYIKNRTGNNAFNIIHFLNDSLLLLGTFEQSYIFNKNNKSFSDILTETPNFDVSGMHDILEIDNNLLIASATGIYIYDKKENIFKVQNDNYNFSQMISENIWSLIKYNENEIWAAKGDGYYKINKYKITFSNLSSDDFGKDFQVREIFKDSRNNIWFGTTNGIILYEYYSGKNIFLKNHPLNIESLSSDRISKIYEDDTGIIWIATFGGGVNKTNLNNNIFKNYSYINNSNNDNLNINFIMHIYGDHNDNLWISSLDKGYAYYDKKEKKFFHFNLNTKNLIDKSGTFFSFVFPYGHNKILTFDNDNIYSYSFNKNLDLKLNYTFPQKFGFTTLLQDKNNIFWGGSPWGIVKFIEDKKFNYIKEIEYFNLNNYINVILDDDSVLWAGGKGLIKFNKKNNSFINYSLSDFFPNSGMTEIIYSLIKDDNGNLWLGTYGDGLIKFNINSKEFEQFTVSNGLQDNTVYSLLLSNNILWFGTNRGISSFNISNYSVVNYEKSNGLLNVEFNRNSSYADKRGYFYFGGIDGIDYYHPDSLIFNNYSTNLFLTNFKVLNKPYMLDVEYSFVKEIHLSYKQNFFSFEFSLLDYTNPSGSNYFYKLNGIDKDWIKAGNNNYANYTHITPGKYSFNVKAVTSGGVKNKEDISILINIYPPFWRTNWFIILSVIVFIAVILFLISVKTRRLEKEKNLQFEFSKNLIMAQEQERQRIARELHDGIGQNLLIIKNKSSMVNEVEMKDLALQSINELREISYNLHPHQIMRLGLTNGIESIFTRLNGNVNIKFSLNIENIDDFIPKENEINIYRIIQESVSNIINHSEANEATINISKKENKILIEIEDNGKGFDTNIIEKRDKSVFGLSGIIERTKIIGGSVEIVSIQSLGTKINIYIPVK